MKKVFGARAGEPRGPAYTPSTRTFQVAEDIIPIAELKTRLSNVVRSLDARRPLIVTLNGKPAAVLMSPREFDRLSYNARFITAVNAGLADADAGRTEDAEEAFDELEAEFGLARAKKKPKTR